MDLVVKEQLVFIEPRTNTHPQPYLKDTYIHTYIHTHAHIHACMHRHAKYIPGVEMVMCDPLSPAAQLSWLRDFGKSVGLCESFEFIDMIIVIYGVIIL